MNWIITNWAAVVAIVTGILAVAAAIVKLTPTTKDDIVLAKVESVVDTVEKLVPAAAPVAAPKV